MELKITKQEENKLLDRIEVVGEITFEGNTPKNVDVTQQLATKLGTKVELVVVKHIHTRFGHQIVDFDAFAYKTDEAKQKAEMNTKHLKKKAEEDKKKADEAVKAAAEKKEEPKVEEKPAEEAPAPVVEEKPAEEPVVEKPVVEPVEEVKEAPQEEASVENPIDKDLGL